MKIESKRFGVMEIHEKRVIHFKGGLLGFPHLTRFFLADDPDHTEMPFKWLVSLEDPEIGFVVTDPGVFFRDYFFDLEESERASLAVTSAEEVSVITLLTIPEDPRQITANLRGPLVINWKTMQGKQIILKGMKYTTKHFVFLQNQTNQSQLPEISVTQESIDDSKLLKV